MTRPAAGPADAIRPDARLRSFRLVLEYDGTHFEGWQTQAGPRPARTVQGVLEEAIVSIGGTAVRVRGAGRTDAGVHALAQVASVRFEGRFEAPALHRALNAQLPRDVAVLAVDEIPVDWDALREARGKHYRYQIWNGRVRSPLRETSWHWVASALDVAAMQRAAGLFVGRHDFAAFQAAGSSAKTSVRRLEALECTGQSGDEIRLDVRGEGFLRHMVRNLAGTLIEIGRGRWAPEQAGEILRSGERGRAGPTAPAQGLVLVAVRDSWSEAMAEETSEARSGGLAVDETGPVG